MDSSGAWPLFLRQRTALRATLQRAVRRYPSWQFVLRDGGHPVANAASFPLYWDGDAAQLPGGHDEILRRAARPPTRDPNTLGLVSLTVAPEFRGRGYAARALDVVIRRAGAAGFDHVVVPLRPTRKHLFPRVPLEDYIGWSREGEPFDPWLRLHLRRGGRLAGIAHHSMVVRGTLTQWRLWTGLTLDGSGSYVVPGGLVPIEVDVDRDLGLYDEPNVWIVHSTRHALALRPPAKL